MRLVALILLFILAACQSQGVHGELPIHAPAAILAGESIDVLIGPVAVQNGTPVSLVMVGLHGPYVYRTQFEDGLARITIPAKVTFQPGYFMLIAASGSARGTAAVRLLVDGTSQTAFTEFNVNQKVDPWPGSLITPISPFINLTRLRLIASPSPVPPYLRVVEPST